jgi:hypothetical protein
MSIAWPTTLRSFKNNLESLHQYTEAGIKLSGIVTRAGPLLQFGNYSGVVNQNAASVFAISGNTTENFIHLRRLHRLRHIINRSGRHRTRHRSGRTHNSRSTASTAQQPSRKLF